MAQLSPRQGQYINLDGVERRKLGLRELWGVAAKHIRPAIGVIPSSQNLGQGVCDDPASPFRYRADQIVPQDCD